MKNIFTSALLALLVLSGIADAQTPLRQSTSRVVRICGAVAVGDGFTPVTTLALGTADEAEALRDNTATLDISGATFSAITGSDGCYSLTLDTTATNTVGELVVVIQDDSLILPIKRTFQVVEESVFDAFYVASADLDVNLEDGSITAAVIGTGAIDADAIATDAIGAAEIAASAIGASELATDAIGADELAASALAEINTENDNAIVTYGLDHLVSAAVTGTDVADNSIIARMVDDAATADWDGYANTNASLEALRARGDAAWATGGGGASQFLHDDTAQAGSTASTLVIAATASFADSILRGNTACIDGGTGAGQCRYISANVLSTDTLTVEPDWITTPDATSTYYIKSGSVNVAAWSNDAASVEAGLEDSADIWAATTRTLTAATNITSTGGTTVPQTGDSFTRIGVAGAGLTNIDLPNQTMDITGTLSGSVGSVTGNVGGNVVGSVANVTGGINTAAGTITTLDSLDSAQDTQHGTTQSAITALNDPSAAAIVSALLGTACAAPGAGTIEEQICTDLDAVLAGLEMHMLLDTAFLNCEVNTANFAGSTTTVACILTDRDDGAVTQASNDLEGLELVITSGTQIREKRFITDSTWDGANSELQLTLSRALPGTLADAVTAVIR